jgi:hypothetical protein
MRSLLAAIIAHAALLLPTVATAATVYEVNTTGATITGSKNNDVFIGQSFNSGTNTLLTSAALEINRNGLSAANFTLTLQLATGSASNYFATGGNLYASTFSNSILSDSLETFYTFTDLNWNLSPNTVYMIGIEQETNPSVKWTLNQSTRSTSTGFITGYAGYNAQRGTSVDDGLHGATITAVPEPSSLAALALGLSCVAAIRRRRFGKA